MTGASTQGASIFPMDVWPVIIDFLTACEACRLSMVSRTLHQLLIEECCSFWRDTCYRRYSKDTCLHYTRSLPRRNSDSVWRRLASCWWNSTSLKRAMFNGMRRLTLEADTEFIVHGHVAVWCGNSEVVRRVSVEPDTFGQVLAYKYPRLEFDDVVPLAEELLVASGSELQVIGAGSNVSSTIPYTFDYDEEEVTRLFLDMASSVLYVLHKYWLVGYEVCLGATVQLKELYTVELPLTDVDALMFRACIGQWAILHDSQRRILVYESRTGRTIADENLPLEDECIVYADAWPPWLLVLTPRELYRINISDGSVNDKSLWEAFPVAGTGIAGVEFRRCVLEVKVDPKDPDQFLLLSSPYFDGESALVLCRRSAPSTLTFVASYVMEAGYFCDRLEYRHDGTVIEVCIGKRGMEKKIAGVYNRVVWLSGGDLSVLRVFENAVGEWRTDVRDCAASIVSADDEGVVMTYWNLMKPA